MVNVKLAPTSTAIAGSTARPKIKDRANAPAALPSPDMSSYVNLSLTEPTSGSDSTDVADTSTIAPSLLDILYSDLVNSTDRTPARAKTVLRRMISEVERVCEKSRRIQRSGEVRHWQLSLARHRLNKCLGYYNMGNSRGRQELHTTLSAIVYRYVAPANVQMGFQARYVLIEDFMQAFYIESLRAFRRENDVDATYQPRTRLELAEYLMFTEQYAKRRISLPGCRNQQLVVLRAKTFSRRLPPELNIDIEQAVEAARTEEAEAQARSSAAQQVREKMVSEAVDPSEAVLRDRIVQELIQYLKDQNQEECIDYFTLRLQDMAAPEIDEILGLTSRQRDYLQQRFKYHVERFARIHQWDLVHQWLGAELDTRLGLSVDQWDQFWAELDDTDRNLVSMKQLGVDDDTLAGAIACTHKQTQKRWFKLLSKAWTLRNGK
ncbi:MAG: hypothetical protein AAF685_17505 [Cyanobacteria bacterium P01_C01_bin.89]